MTKEQLQQQLETSLAINGANESSIQMTLEAHPELIPMPFLLNHRHHFNLMLKKYPLPNGQETDFLYFTKSTVEWWAVLIELESSNKRIFTTRGNGNPVFHSDFNNAYDQIIGWKGYLEQNPSPMKESILPILMHMHQNTITYKFVLVIGRNSEIVTQQQKNLFRQKNTEHIRVMTYDSLINSFMENPIDSKLVASKSINGYRIQNLNNADTNIFSYLSHGDLHFDDTIKQQLINKGYNIPAWQSGKLLSVNNKEPKPSHFP